MSKTLDVVAGNIIDDAWGNEIRDRTLQVFATVAERDSQWPTAPNGATCVTLDTGRQWIRIAGGWQPAWPRLVSALALSTTGTVTSTTPIDVPGASISVPLYSGRAYRIAGWVCVLNNGTANTVVNLYVTDVANTVIIGPANMIAPGFYLTIPVEVFHQPTVATSYKLRISNSGGATHSVSYATNTIFSVTDMGIMG
jgi:hypothetical protein